MAVLETTLQGNFEEVLRQLEQAVTQSISASYEGGSDFTFTGGRCAVRVYERYSAVGGNRVSLNLTLLEADGVLGLSAITSGGSQAMFFKINTWGEEAFLDTIRETVEHYR